MFGKKLVKTSNDWKIRRRNFQPLENPLEYEDELSNGAVTKQFAVLGHPIGHSLSPVMHNAAFRALGMDANYTAIDVPPENLMAELASMAEKGFGGVNLTVPLKEVAAKGLEKLDESAQAMGAVNTVQFTPSGMVGYNTDGEGFLRAFEEAFGTPVSGKSVFVMGTGGAGRALALSCAGSGVLTIKLCDLDQTRAKKLAMELETQYFVQDVEVVDPSGAPSMAKKCDVVIQSTPVGMKKEDASPLPSEAFREGQLAFDLIYMYPETAFMKAAQQGGAKASNGLGMLLHQGARAFEIWTGVTPPVDVMRAALETEVYG